MAAKAAHTVTKTVTETLTATPWFKPALLHPENLYVELTSQLADYASTETLRQFVGVIYGFLAFSVFVTYFLAEHWNSVLKREAEAESQYVDAFRHMWSVVRDYRALIGLVEQYIYGRIPWAPWDVSYIQHHWEDKRYLKRFIRAGIIPLDIREGGIRTYEKRGKKLRGLSALWGRNYVQTKSRAYFQFMVLLSDGPRGIPSLDRARNDFLERLLAQDRYAVSVSSQTGLRRQRVRHSSQRTSEGYLEAGTESWFLWMLPFKRDRIIKDGVAQGDDEEELELYLDDFIESPLERLPLLALKSSVLVQVEALDYSPARLDQFVYQKAREAKISDIWTEDELSRSVATLYARYQVDWKDESILE